MTPHVESQSSAHNWAFLLRALRPIVGCSFEPRCKYAIAACRAGSPPPVELRPGRYACCIRTGRLSETAAAAATAAIA